MEKQLAGIWSRILNLPVEKIGINDSFFELGGHSLATVQLMAKINKTFGQLLPLAVMFTAPTIAGLAKLISDKKTVPIQILVPIQTNGNAPPVFGVPGAGGNVLSLRLLGKTLGETQPFYGLQAVGLDGATQPLESVEQTAQANIAALKTIQPCGPYSLLGHSYGGVVAFEMARVLLEQAEQISSLILIDSIAPWVMQGMQAGDEAAELFDACMEIASLHGASLDIDLNRLRRSSNGETVQYIVHSLNKIGVEIDAGQFTAFLGVYRANESCYRRYNPPMLPRVIDVSLYRATQRHQERAILPPDYGWNQLLQSPVRLYDVDADHFSILKKNIFKNRVESNQHEHEAAKSAD
jgi:thioesterase domain-containing protein/acyl carrier protein